MRVVAGKYKGYNIKSPKATNSRPTDNKVKEAIFAMLYPIKDEACALDLFACTGQMGIEFLSRGAKYVVFNELNFKNYDVLKENLSNIKALNFKTYKKDFRKCLESLNELGESFDYIFLDPPYKDDYIYTSLKLILKYDLLSKEGIIITESDRNLDFSDEFALQIIKEKSYGRKVIKFYKQYESDISR
ncbi:MAG: 16S rRNA (guanine(966)-N(2))-methyltransferase RsmD [Peptoniphilaceae bacterium]|nr:16S rRNA (guanine(966)-N(2))-methyltransferase RsmD [Peptoniphilaceae bacterium]MDY6019400.1 16S rRNA (guanine(966)-N(2))-methyltransferase RsmD [Anaerococcus sp.]